MFGPISSSSVICLQKNAIAHITPFSVSILKPTLHYYNTISYKFWLQVYSCVYFEMQHKHFVIRWRQEINGTNEMNHPFKPFFTIITKVWSTNLKHWGGRDKTYCWLNICCFFKNLCLAFCVILSFLQHFLWQVLSAVVDGLVTWFTMVWLHFVMYDVINV